MRDLIFRGKRKENGYWISGGVCEYRDFGGAIVHNIIQDGFSNEVIPATIGQFTGLKDKNGSEIFEGDILRSSVGAIYIVEWDGENARYLGFTIGKERRIVYVGREPKSEIIGNIHDNPELLKGESDE